MNDEQSSENDNMFSELQSQCTETRKESSRREMLKYFASASLVSLSVAPLSANAVVAEIDSKSGELFSPKKAMLGGGGSDLARGIKLESREVAKNFAESRGQPIQNIYNTRFVTYLSRFLLNFDPAAKSWWEEQEFIVGAKTSIEAQQKLRFAEFAESVEVGLGDYFIGPYGSYASVQAAMAGLQASNPVVSSSSGYISSSPKINFFDQLKGGFNAKSQNIQSNEKARKQAKQGVLNLLSLLKARYRSTEEKKQLVILFSLMTDQGLQPTAAIKGLLGEIDNASISGITLSGLLEDHFSQIEVRESSHRGGGYAFDEFPIISVDAPPSLGDEFKPAKLEPIMKETSRILKIRIIDSGKGYTSIPKVDVIQGEIEIPCDAVPILDRNGGIESIVVLNPGLGYGGNSKPEVRISPPKRFRRATKKDVDKFRTAVAVADLEYAITGVYIIDGGNGYIRTEPPNANISPPAEEPDWYMSPIDQTSWVVNDISKIEASVSSLTCSDSGEKFTVDTEKLDFDDMLKSDPSILKMLENNPLALLPSSLRPYYFEPGESSPESDTAVGKDGVYTILSLPAPSNSIMLPSQRYRAFDNIFGGIGAKPVIKGAQALNSDEYARIALSGAVCTVIVRTALNPLELVKTKIQLQNDEQLIQMATKTTPSQNFESQESTSETDKKNTTSLSTADMIKSLIALRGPFALFQSADITFLASLVFGSFGFGATELFRRSFSMIFFSDGGGGGLGGGEIILLLAAAIACILTSLAAAPFELLRVRSMGYVEAIPVKTVLSDFLKEKRQKRAKKSTKDSEIETSTISLKNISKDDISALFSGFYPIVSRELPFAVVKFLIFDLVASFTLAAINAQPLIIEPIQVGVGTIGLGVSAGAGAIAGIFGAFVSHPPDLILTLISSNKGSEKTSESDKSPDWKDLVKELLAKEGGVFNLYAGFPARATFFFLVIGLQFFLYDYAKNVFHVGSEDLTLVLDVFYAIRQGLVNMAA